MKLVKSNTDRLRMRACLLDEDGWTRLKQMNRMRHPRLLVIKWSLLYCDGSNPMSERIAQPREAMAPAKVQIASAKKRPLRPSQVYRKMAPGGSTTFKWRDAALVVCFALGISLPLAGLALHADAGFVLEENRVLASRPELTRNLAELASLPSRFEGYFNDQFGFRKRLIHWLSLAKVAILGVSPSPKVILGRNGWLFYGDIDLPYYRRIKTLTPAQLEAWRHHLEERQAWLAARGIPYLIVIPPIKSTIYNELMPLAYNRMNLDSLVDQLTAHLKAHSNLTVVELRAPLLEAKTHHQVYYRTDTHWNNRGAYVGYQEIMKVLCRWLPELEVLPISAFEDVEYNEPGRDLSLILGMRQYFSDRYVDLRMKRPALASEARPGPPSGKLETTGGDILFEHPDKERPRLLMFRDSFASWLIPLLSESFSRSLYSWQYTFDREIVERERPDVVIQEMVERALMAGSPPI
jgi:alginate O-acetyltransferase complex protein AlgJ